jgi:hypothetical protein
VGVSTIGGEHAVSGGMNVTGMGIINIKYINLILIKVTYEL